MLVLGHYEEGKNRDIDTYNNKFHMSREGKKISFYRISSLLIQYKKAQIRKGRTNEVGNHNQSRLEWNRRLHSIRGRCGGKKKDLVTAHRNRR